MKQYESPDTILIAPNEKCMRRYRKILANQGVRLRASQCFSLNANPRTFEGLRVSKVLVAEAEYVEFDGKHWMAVQILNNALARTPDRQGYFSVSEDGEIRGTS